MYSLGLNPGFSFSEEEDENPVLHDRGGDIRFRSLFPPSNEDDYSPGSPQLPTSSYSPYSPGYLPPSPQLPTPASPVYSPPSPLYSPTSPSYNYTYQSPPDLPYAPTSPSLYNYTSNSHLSYLPNTPSYLPYATQSREYQRPVSEIARGLYSVDRAREVESPFPLRNRIEPEDNSNVVRDDSSGNDESITCCSICINPYSSQGDHQVSCLPCGHLYGLSCIQRWIKHSKQDYSKCPVCNQKCLLKDVVRLYVPWLPVVESGKQQSSVSYQPQDNLYKVQFAKFERELADIRREMMSNAERSERVEKICMRYEDTQKRRRSFDKELTEIKEDFRKKFKELNKTIDRSSEEQSNKIDALFRMSASTLRDFQRTFEQQKHDIEAKDKRIKELEMSLERQDVQIHQMKKRRKQQVPEPHRPPSEKKNRAEF
ncbi:hypothetical protein MKX01_027374 [Papaver californicum]|nr:hypothetical protein MKX01_027374 [Papaver californicum]